MRRTTICRSSVVFAAVLSVAGFSNSAAQNPPAIQRPINQAREVQQQGAQRVQQQGQVGQDAAQQSGRVQLGAGMQGQQGSQQSLPAVHVVQQGESLWSLAQQYFGDPLLWPELYRHNTDIIEDPHWIYPGEELRLQPGEPVVVAEGNVTVTPSGDSVRTPVQVAQMQVTTGTTVFSPRERVISGTDIDTRTSTAYRAVRAGEYYSAGFLTEGQELVAGRVIANAQTPMRGNIRSRSSSNIFESVVIAPPRGTAVDTGSLMLAFRRGDEVPGYGLIIVPTGLVRVYNNATDRHLAEVVRLFERMTDGQELLPIAAYESNDNRRPTPVMNGVQGRVLRLRDRREVATVQEVLFIDKGANDGVRLGDVFAISITLPDGQGGSLNQDQGRALVVGTRDRTSTAIIVELYRGDVGSQSLARQIGRIQ